MGDFPHYFDIILFAMVAAFLVLRLRSVLGRRTGNERRPDTSLFRRPQRPAEPVADKVVAFGNRTAAPPPLVTTTPADAVAAGLERVRGADPGFDAPGFLQGARIAFETIVGAFAAGDQARLRPLLADDVYKPFAAAIDERVAAGETLETRVLQLKAEDIVEAGLAGRTARVTVKFVSDQINVLRAHDGSIVDGDPEHPTEKTDFWSFARDTHSADPNWVLVATASG
jgi:predicted lipid-binding transport protein (Tim44 family)